MSILNEQMGIQCHFLPLEVTSLLGHLAPESMEHLFPFPYKEQPGPITEESQYNVGHCLPLCPQLSSLVTYSGRTEMPLTGTEKK